MFGFLRFLDIFGGTDPFTGYISLGNTVAIPIVASPQMSLLPETSWAVKRVLPDGSAVSTSNASGLSSIEINNIYGKHNSSGCATHAESALAGGQFQLCLTDSAESIGSTELEIFVDGVGYWQAATAGYPYAQAVGTLDHPVHRDFHCFSSLASIEDGVYSIRIEQRSPGSLRLSHLLYVWFEQACQCN